MYLHSQCKYTCTTQMPPPLHVNHTQVRHGSTCAHLHSHPHHSMTACTYTQQYNNDNYRQRVINSQGFPQYYQGTYMSSSSSTSGSGTPMDIGAANTCPQPHGKGLQCYNCQGFGHIAHECTQPRRPRQQQQTQSAQQQGGNFDDKRINAVCGMSFAEMRDFFKNLKD